MIRGACSNDISIKTTSFVWAQETGAKKKTAVEALAKEHVEHSAKDK